MAEEKLNTGQGEQITMDETVTPADLGPDKESPTAPETITPEVDTRPESEKAPWERPLADLEA